MENLTQRQAGVAALHVTHAPRRRPRRRRRREGRGAAEDGMIAPTKGASATVTFEEHSWRH